jgi:N-methylhydantoinase B
MPIRRGQVLRHVTAGAGGYGDPLERDPARVLADVASGKVSAAAAEREYGVRVLGPPWRLDDAGTGALRSQRRGTGSAGTAAPPPPGGPGGEGRVAGGSE